MTQSNLKKDFEEEKSKIFSDYQNKVVEKLDYKTLVNYVKTLGVREYDVESLTSLYINGKIEHDEYYYLRDRWESYIRSAADAK